jgi:hypothetical protein
MQENRYWVEKRLCALIDYILLYSGNMFFFEDLNIVIKDNLNLFYFILSDNKILFYYLLKIEMCRGLGLGVLSFRSSVVFFKLLQHLLILEVYKKYAYSL